MFQRHSKGHSADGRKINSRSDVTVAVRVRPLNAVEQERGEQGVVFCPDQHNLQVRREGQVRPFSFHMVLGPESSQQEVFQACQVNRLVDMAVQGRSCAVFAFGQTGSGKTYTVTGPHPEVPGGQEPVSHGLVQRSLSHLLGQVQPRSTAGEVTLRASYLEIYNEQVWDLLDPRRRRPLAVRGSATRGFYVENLSAAEFCSLDDFTELLEKGLRNRHTSCHQMERSSRGHSILTVYIRTAATGTDGDGGAAQGKLSLVDLAGSERGRDTELQEETSNINRSLLSLGKCIAALVDAKGRDRHIPYRDSKLTKLLSDSLGGTGVTLMIACVSPSAACLPETLNTLYYSSRAKRIRARPTTNREQREKLVHSLKREVHLLSRENLLLRQRLSSFQEARRRGLEAKNSGSSRPNSVECVWENGAESSKQTGGSRESSTVERAEPMRPGSSPCLLRGLSREEDRLQKVIDSFSPGNHQPAQTQETRVASSSTPPRPPQDSTRARLPSHPPPAGLNPHSAQHPPAFLPPLRPPRPPEPCCHCHWRPLLSCCLCVTRCALQGLVQCCTLGHCGPCEPLPLLRVSCMTGGHRQGTLPPLSALGSDRAPRAPEESTKAWPDRHSNETDPRRQLECMGYSEWIQEAGRSSDQRDRPVRPRPLMSPGRVAPSAPPLPVTPAPFSSRFEGGVQWNAGM